MDEALFQRWLERERRARREAEALLESKARELWEVNQQLRALATSLEQRVELRTAELREALERAVGAEQQAAASNQAKSRFLASISHEIRTPLNAILGYARLLREKVEDTDVESREWLEHLLRNAEHMTELLGDVLDLSRIEADRLELELHPVELLPLVQEIVALVEPRAKGQDLPLSLVLRPPLPAMVTSDGLRIQQIVLNLLTNALKFTSEGSVTLEVAMVAGLLRISVKDTGIGISPAGLATIWEPFTQAHDSQERWFGGTGLGLDICRRLATLLGGRMGASSTLHVGSTFWLELPVTEVQLQDTMPEHVLRRTVHEPPPRLDGVRLLVVDDSADNRRLMQLILERAGAEVTLRVNGREAVDLLVAEPDAVDLVLMDLQMPVLDGLDAARALREAGATLPILAVTADVTPRSRRLAMDAGCDGRLTKPVQPALLLRRLRSHLRDLPVGVPVSRAPLDVGLPAALLDYFHNDLRVRLGELEAAVAEGSTVQVATLAHQIAGSGGSYGYPDLTERARAVVRGVSDGLALDRLPLEALFAEVRAVLA